MSGDPPVPGPPSPTGDFFSLRERATSPSTRTTQENPASSIQQIAESAAMQEVADLLKSRRDWIDEVQIALTRIPAPTFHESTRAAAIAEHFRNLGLAKVRLDSAGNVLAERPGATSPCVALTAHIDTVVPGGVPIEVRRSGGRICAPGITDNGAGLAALLGAAAVLQDSSVATEQTILFVANVGEEGEGDLHGMRSLLAQPELRRRISSLLVLDGAAVDHVTVAGLGSRRFLVEVSGPGGHSWKDFGRVNPVHALARAISQLSQISLSTDPRTTLNIGVIQGGTAINSIPSSAWMKVDIRSADRAQIDRLALLLDAAAQNAVEQENGRGTGELKVRLLQIGDRPAGELPQGSALLRTLRAVDRHLGIASRLERSSTDANIPLSLGMEAVCIGGGGKGGDAHTMDEWYDPQGRGLGLKRILLTVLAMAKIVEASRSIAAD